MKIDLIQFQLPPHLQGLLPRWPLLPPSGLPGLNPALFKSGDLKNTKKNTKTNKHKNKQTQNAGLKLIRSDYTLHDVEPVFHFTKSV